MDFCTLPQSDLYVSRLCFGTMTFGGQADEATSQRLLDTALDAGIRFLDTANVYNQGASEEILGRALRGRRAKVILASKVRGKMGPGPDESGLSKAAMVKAVEDTLRRLQTDYLDLYYLHQPDYQVPIEETLEAMQDLVESGKVRYPACSNYAAWQMVQMRWIAIEDGFRPIPIAQPMYNLLARGIEAEYLPMCKQVGYANVVYNPLAGGLLTGKQRQAAPQPGSRFDGNQMYLDRYWHEAQFSAVQTLEEAARRAGRSLVSLALNWILHHTPVECLILGASRPEQLQENLRAAEEGPLDPDTLKICDEAWTRLRGVTPQYNR